jgi:hypothetical protein
LQTTFFNAGELEHNKLSFIGKKLKRNSKAGGEKVSKYICSLQTPNTLKPRGKRFKRSEFRSGNFVNLIFGKLSA